jgi:outer membrane protein assembly factor BamB
MRMSGIFCRRVLAMAATATLLAPTLASAGDTTTFRGNAAHSGIYRAPPITATPAVSWRFHTDGYVISSPALADGTVYVGSTDRFLYALDAATGRQKWKFKTGARIASSPAVANGLVYFESYDGNFYAVDTTSGEERWHFATQGERRFAAPHIHGSLPVKDVMPDPFDYYLSSPALANGMVYFGSGDGNVYALDAASGALKWAFATGNVVHASPAVAGGLLYIGSWDHFFYALDAKSGRLAWKFETGTDNDIHNQEGIQSSAVVADGVVYFGCRDSNLYALDAKTGAKRWVYNNGGNWVISSPAVSRGMIYWETSDGGLFHATDAATGKDRFTLDFKHWPMFSSPAVVGDFVYFGSHNGRFYAVDTKTEAIAWSYETDLSRKNGPALTNADGTPNYRAVSHENFYDSLVIAANRMFETGMIVSSPAVGSNGTVYFGSMDGDVYALRAKG